MANDVTIIIKADVARHLRILAVQEGYRSITAYLNQKMLPEHLGMDTDFSPPAAKQ